MPTVPATIMLFDEETGQPECIMDATFLTALRTAAGEPLRTVRVRHCPIGASGALWAFYVERTFLAGQFYGGGILCRGDIPCGAVLRRGHSMKGMFLCRKE